MTRTAISYGLACFTRTDQEYKLLFIRRAFTYGFDYIVETKYLNSKDDKLNYISSFSNNFYDAHIKSRERDINADEKTVSRTINGTSVKAILCNSNELKTFLRSVTDRQREYITEIIRKLLKETTYDERLMFLNGNYLNMWYYTNKCHPVSFDRKRGFFRKELKFHVVLAIIGQANFIKMINDENVYGNNLWTLPKGKPNPKEMPIETAMREFEEESGLSRKDVKICNIKPFIESYISWNVTYKNFYYFAYVDSSDINLSETHNINEVSSVKWLSKNNIKNSLLSPVEIHKSHLLFTKLLNKFKGNIRLKIKKNTKKENNIQETQVK